MKADIVIKDRLHPTQMPRGVAKKIVELASKGEVMELKEEILHQLSRGRENALTGRLLAKRLGFNDDRLIRLTIREMIADGIPIASSTQPPAGYFISETLEESVDYMRDLKSRLVENAYRLRDFKRASREILGPHQMVLL